MSLKVFSNFLLFAPQRVAAYLKPRWRSTMRKLVGRARLELATNGLKVRCSTD
jgi:hypothetical protein